LVEILFKACAFCSKSSPAGPPITTKGTEQRSIQTLQHSEGTSKEKTRDLQNNKKGPQDIKS